MSLVLPTVYDSLIAVSLNAFRVQLPGVVSWARPRGVVRQGGVRSAYPGPYVAGRAAWTLVVQHAVATTGWVAPPVEAPLLVEVEVVARGRRDVDRVLSAVLDALQAGKAILDDCRVTEVHLVRRAPGRGEPPHVDALLSVADTRPLTKLLREVS